jgi:hypothetical protein
MPGSVAAGARLVFLRAGGPQAKGAVERLQGYMEGNFEPGRHFANHLDFQLQLDAWLQKGERAHPRDAAGAADRPDWWRSAR